MTGPKTERDGELEVAEHAGAGPGAGPGADAGAGSEEPARIAVLSSALADQIAAGEVVERPGSIVKELVENAIDAGATRIEVELVAGGRERIRVVDDGRGIHREDLLLAVTRHATSKLRVPEQLVEIHTLGFRGEALASIAAVARVELRSRRVGETVGYRLAVAPHHDPRIEPIGMPFGTQIEVAQLFANVPARRKFLRAEATEVGHCVDAVIRAALVHPKVGFRVRHDGRELLELRADTQTNRVVAVLERRGGQGPFHHFAGERDGISVEGWFGPPSAAVRQRHASFVVVRRRVVRERTLAATLKQAYAESLEGGAQPVACVFVEPPPGTVDVNVHPQKSEVRFSAAQRVYAVTRELIDEGLASAPWRRGHELGAEPGPDLGSREDDTHDWAAGPGSPAGAALAGWSRREGLGAGVPAREPAGTGSGSSYRLGTRAAGTDYGGERQRFRGEVDRLRSSLAAPRERGFDGTAPTLPTFEHAFDDPGERPELELELESPTEAELGPRMLTCLPGPVAVFELDGELLVADLCQLRSHLVRRRLARELAATQPDGQAPAQALLRPIVVARPPEQHGRLVAAASRLRRLGLELEGFGPESVLVRAVPAVLPKVLDEGEVAGLLDRLIPWLGLRGQGHEGGREAGIDEQGFAEAIADHSATAVRSVSPRMAKQWIVELLRELDGPAAAHGSSLAEAGVRRWSVAALLGGP